MTETIPYGEWPSPLSAHSVAAGSHPIESGRYVGDEIWWVERVPAERGRSAVRREGREGGESETLLPAPWDVRSRVHEYGGGAWCVEDDGIVFFCENTDQRIWRFVPGSAPIAITPGDLGMRFADLARAGERIIAVRETHREGGRSPQRDIVSIPIDGSAAGDPTAISSLVVGSDFFAYPRISPDGCTLAWIQWDHPRMPWDGTELRVGGLSSDGVVRDVRIIAGGENESVVQPEWISPDAMLFSSDRTGRWNVFHADLAASADPTPAAPADADTGGPLWNLGLRWFAPLADGRIVMVRTNGSDDLAVRAEGSVRVISTEVSSRVLLSDVRGSRVLFTGSGATTLGGLWEFDVDHPATPARLVRSAVDAEPDAAWLPVARAVSVEGPLGTVHAFAYPPTNPDVANPHDETPPYLVLAHGGPTTHVSGGASLDIAFFTSRGIGVLDVNYGGSTGYGRAYRERLNGQWGIVDRDDVVAAASGLSDAGLADGDRLAIRGGSAGGWTVLCALTASERFAAGISRYGVADLRALATDTHDFEARYLDRLVGPYPDAEAVYIDRSPLTHLDRFTTPMLIEQGLDDRVVPPAQSEAVCAALAERGLAHAYLAFEGEGHGFRMSDTIIASLEAELSFLGQILGFTPVGVPRLALS